VSEAQDPSGLRIGPVAHDLLLENDDVKIWRVNTEPGQMFWNHEVEDSRSPDTSAAAAAR
jgi:hypothetical protein